MFTTEMGMKAAKNLAKAYNFGARNSDSDYLVNRLDEEMRKMDDNRAAAMNKAKRATRKLRGAVLTKTSFLKRAVQYDSLGKMSSPAMQGGGVDAPMPQTEFAKGTLNNEYANLLNKRQLAEMRRLRERQDQNSSSQDSQNSTQTSSTSSSASLTNSGLMASLSIGSVGGIA